MAKKSNAAKIRDYVAGHPDAKPAELATKFGVSLAYVYVLRSQMKKAEEKDWVLTDAMVNTKSGEVLHNKPAPVPDMVNHPAHYKAGGIETIDFIEAKKLNYHLGNVVKYIARADLKDDRLENLQKAKWYLQREIARMQTERFVGSTQGE
jgi:hypothetical protein